MDIKIPNHQVTAHSPSTLEKIKKVGIGQKLADIEKTFGSTYRRLDLINRRRL